MTTTKNPGLGARSGSVSAALAAAQSSQPAKLREAEAGVPVTALSVRLPKPMYDALRKIVFEEGNRGNRISIHSLMMEGIAKVIVEKSEAW